MDDTQPTEPLPPQQPPAASQHAPATHPSGPQEPPYGSGAHPGWAPSGSAHPGSAHPGVVYPVAEPFYKRHGLAFAISTLVLAVLLLFGMAGVGAYAVSSVLFHAGSPLSRLLTEGGHGRHFAPVPKAPGQNGDQGGRHDEGPIAKGVVRAKVTAISGTTWTVRTQRGATLTVDTTSSTAFGAPGQSQSASDFAVGDEIVVVGTRSGSTVTAMRILKVSDLPIGPLPSQKPVPSPSPSR